MLESVIERHLMRRMRAIEGEAYKWVSPARVGVPDRICVFPSGKVVFVELKAPGKVPSVRQEREHRRLRELNQTVEVIDTLIAVNRMLNKYHV